MAAYPDLDRAATGVGYRQVTTLILSLCAGVTKRCVETEETALAHSPDFRDARLMQLHVMFVTVIVLGVCTYLEFTLTFGGTSYNERKFLVTGLHNSRISD